jgi:NAD(P)-dependent dehydrogenase (short-subunit alcohol dehydrogenase family)
MVGEGPVAVVTGANRGIGREVARQLAQAGHLVVLGCRDSARGQRAARDLDPTGRQVVPVQLDVADAASIRAAADQLSRSPGRVDVLVNNAAVDYDTDQRAVTADLGRVRRAMETNLYGAWATTQALLPLLRLSEHPGVVNISSGAGSPGDERFGLTARDGAAATYAISKAALNALTETIATELADTPVLVNAVCPRPHRDPPGRRADGRATGGREREGRRVGGHAARRRPARRLLPGRTAAGVVSARRGPPRRP